MRFLALFLILLPAVALAAPVPAGFPSSSLWLSKTELTDGENVTIYTVVYNSSSESLTGSVTFLVDGQSIGQKDVTAGPGTTQIVSHTWSAKEGSHAFSATLSGSVADLAASITGTTTVAVAPKPPPPEAVTKTVETAGAVQAAIASTTPIIGNIASTTFARTESIREQTVAALEKLASTTAPKGEVLGAEDEAEAMSPEENAARSFDVGGWIQNVWQAVLGALLFIARSPLWFYAAVGAVLLLVVMFLKAAFSGRDRYR